MNDLLDAIEQPESSLPAQEADNMSEGSTAANTARQAATLGLSLAAARQAQGLSVADVAQAIKFSVRQIEAVERDDFSKLAGATVVRGFIRSYAKLVHADADALLALYDNQVPSAVTGIDLLPEETAPLSQFGGRSHPLRKHWLPLASILLLLLSVAVYFFWQFLPLPASLSRAEKPAATASNSHNHTTGSTDHAGPENSMAAAAVLLEQGALDTVNRLAEAASTPAEAANKDNAAVTAAPADIKDIKVAALTVSDSTGSVDFTDSMNDAAAAATSNDASNHFSNPDIHQLKFDFDETSWVEVKDATNKVIFAQNNPPGVQQIVSGRPPFAVVVGNASRVRLFYEDRQVDLQPYTRVDVARFTLE